MGVLKWLKEMRFKLKLKMIDFESVMNGTAEWDLIPASMYYTHTEEEIEKLRAEATERIQKAIDEL